MFEKLEKLVEIGESKESALDKLRKILPFEEGHKAYKTLKIGVKQTPDGKYLAEASFKLKKGYKTPVQTGTGAYQSPLERIARDREYNL